MKGKKYGFLYVWEEDEPFQKAISEYQQNNSSQLLEIWLSKQQEITKSKYIDEMLNNFFMIHDCYFVSGTSSVFAKFFDKCKTEEKIDCLFRNQVCPQVWFEHPEDFKKLFYSFEEKFCKDKTVSEQFIAQSIKDSRGFWRSIYELHGLVKFQEIQSNVSNPKNFATNIDLWLSKIPQAKQFLSQYCSTESSDVDFPLLAHVYLTYGLEINKNILHLHVSNPPEKLKLFDTAAKYHELNYQLNKKKTIFKKPKL